jgi:TonB-linked SusC/RagA family outer membrane protein
MKKQFVFLFSFALLLFSQMMSAQSITVTGVIYDQSGKTVPGANVVEKGTTNSAAADFDGKYAIKVSGSKAVLVFSAIGFSSSQVTVGTKKEVNATLQDEATSLKEVVVVGYGTAKKKDLTGSIASGNLKQFQEAPNTNILQSLGSLPGVVIGQSNQAGTDPTIKIRGQNSLSGNTGVLIVLDGAIYRGKFTDINPKDVQSVDILKDPSSKAIYGAQAANGVMMVTTKKGKKGSKIVIDYSTFYAIQSPVKNRRVLNRAEFDDMTRTANYNNPANPTPYLPNTNYGTPNPAWNYVNNSGGSLLAILQNSWNAGTDTDWYGEATNESMYTVDHNVSLRGSTESTTFFLSGGFTDQLGWIINDNYSRKSVRINVENKPKEWLTIGANAFGAFSDRSGVSPDLVGLSVAHPGALNKDANGNFIERPIGGSLNPFLITTQDNLDNQNNTSLLLYASIDIPAIKGLNYRINYSNNYRWNQFYNSSVYNGGSASKINQATLDMTLDNIFSYNRRFGSDEKHGINVTGVIGSNAVDYEGTTASATQFSNLALSYNSLEQGLIPKVTSEAWAENFLSQTARVVYDYDGKYFINGSIRRDGYSGFSSSNKWGTFPSFGLGWNITKENFLADSKKIDLLKLRFSYGENGNTTSRYSSLSRFQAELSNQYLYGDNGTTVIGISPLTLANPDLSWEKTVGYNIGFDFGFFDNRITGTVDAYQSDTEDLLWDLPLPAITGFPTIKQNVGGIQNRGIEVSMNFNPVRTTDWDWSFGINYSKNENEVTSLFGKDIDANGKEDDLFPTNNDGSGGLFIGKSIGTIYHYVEDGIYQLGDVVPAGFNVGGYRLKDIDGNGVITPADREIIGTTQPDYQVGFSNNLRWKNFSLKFFINSVQGGIGVNNPWGGTAGGNGAYGTISNIVINNRYSDIDSWTPNNPGAEFAMAGTTTGQAQFSPWRDRSFVRLNDVSFTYEMNSDFIKNNPFTNIKFFISGKNLYTITKWKGWDPETGQGLVAISNTGLPVMKSISFGLDLSF